MGEGRERGERENGEEIEQERERGYERQDMRKIEGQTEKEKRKAHHLGLSWGR